MDPAICRQGCRQYDPGGATKTDRLGEMVAGSRESRKSSIVNLGGFRGLPSKKSGAQGTGQGQNAANMPPGMPPGQGQSSATKGPRSEEGLNGLSDLPPGCRQNAAKGPRPRPGQCRQRVKVGGRILRWTQYAARTPPRLPPKVRSRSADSAWGAWGVTHSADSSSNPDTPTVQGLRTPLL